MYGKALELAQRVEDKWAIGLVMCNLSRLDDDEEAWENAIAYLEFHGYDNIAKSSRDLLTGYRSQKQRSVHDSDRESESMGLIGR